MLYIIGMLRLVAWLFGAIIGGWIFGDTYLRGVWWLLARGQARRVAAAQEGDGE